MVKFREASPGAAYEIAVGVSVEEAAKLGLAVVESDPTTGAPTAFGRYKNAPSGGPLGVTVPQASDTDVVAGGSVSASASAPSAGDKGDFVNPDDPFVMNPPGVDTVHADGSPAAVFKDSTEAAAPAPPSGKTTRHKK